MSEKTERRKNKTDGGIEKQSGVKDVLFYDELVSEIRADFEKRQKMRRPYELSWQLNMNFVMGNQYCAVSGRGEIEQEEKYFFWQEKQVYNHIAPIVETRLSRLNRVRPRPVVRPFSSSDKDVNSAKLSTKILDAVRDKLSLDAVTAQATAWSEVCGTSFYKVAWVSEKVNAGGKERIASDVAVTACSPFEIYPDSNVCQSLEECSSLIHAKVYPVSEIKRIWGADIEGEEVRVFAIDGAQAVGGLGYNSTVPSITHETKNNHAVVIERYTRPDNDNPSGKLEIVAGGKLLYRGDLPYILGEDGKRNFPFVRQTAYEQAGCFWGASVVERVIPVQRAYNAVKNRKHEFLNRLSMGVLAVEDGSVDTDNLEEEGLSPGKILVYRQGSVRPLLMESGNVPADFTYEEDRLLSEFVTVSGVSEFARNSSTPATVTSGVALQLIAEQDDIRLSSSIDSVRQSVRRISKYILRLYKQYVNGEKLMRLTDDEGKAEVFYFKGSDVSSDDIVFETENELTDSPATRRTMLMDLLKAGILYDREGKLPESTKAKILTLMGFGNWENAQDLAQLHIRRASEENIDIDKAEILEVDDHLLHVEEHTRFVISGEADRTGKGVRDKVLAHIALHKVYTGETR